jgi:hypothetical protein
MYKIAAKKGQFLSLEQIGVIILIIIFTPILIGLASSLNHQSCPACPTCDYTPYEKNISICEGNLTKVLNELTNRPVKYIPNTTYIQNTTYVPTPVDDPTSAPSAVVYFSFGVSIVLTLTLFRIKIHLPPELEERIAKIETAIAWAKLFSMILTIILLVRVLIIVF